MTYIDEQSPFRKPKFSHAVHALAPLKIVGDRHQTLGGVLAIHIHAVSVLHGVALPSTQVHKGRNASFSPQAGQRAAIQKHV